jgi:hypothetical protein
MMEEIPETEATGALARCYADIRDRLGVPVVNLIWRHLAAIGVIDACWERVRDDIEAIERHGAALNALARDMIATLPPPATLPWTSPGPQILVSYERGNSLNLATARRLLGCPPPGTGGALPRARGHLPPVPRHADLPPASRAAIERLAAAGPGADTGIRPTLWIHLACLPNLLEAIAAEIPDVLAVERFHAEHARLTALPAGGGTTGLNETATLALQRFNRRIGEMLLIGLYLGRSCPDCLETDP